MAFLNLRPYLENVHSIKCLNYKNSMKNYVFIINSLIINNDITILIFLNNNV